MYHRIVRITDRAGADRTDRKSRSYVGCAGEARMDGGCVFFHCRYDGRGEPVDRFLRTSLVQDWKRDAATGRITVVTMNSVYEMEPVQPK